MQSADDLELKLFFSQRLWKYIYAHINMKMNYCWVDNIHINDKSTFYLTDFIKTQYIDS